MDPQLLLDRLTAAFTGEEQQRFVDNFKLYLEHGADPTKHVVNLDDVWETMGFARKTNAKSLLVKIGKHNVDYVIHRNSPFPDHNVSSTATTVEDWCGVNRETILMNVATFKEMCMLSRTDKGKNTRTFYLKMEQIFFQCLQESHQDAIQLLQKDITRKKELDHQQHLKLNFRNTPCVYLMKISEKKSGHYLVKLGETDDVCQRLRSIRTEYKADCILLEAFPCTQPHKMEQYLLKRPDINAHRLQGKELIQLTEQFTLKMLIEAIRKSIPYFNNTSSVDDRFYQERRLLLEYIATATDAQTRDIFAQELAKLDINKKRTFEDSSEDDRASCDVNQPLAAGFKESETYHRVYKYALDNLQVPVTEFKTLAEAARSLNDPKVHNYHVRDAADNHRILNGFRWYYVDGTDGPPAAIPDTVTIEPKRQRRGGFIAQLNAARDTVINVHRTINEAAAAVGLKGCSVTMAMNKNRLGGGFFWQMWDDCDEPLQATFTRALPVAGKQTNSKQIEQIDPVTMKVVRTYSCIQDVNSEFRICHKKMNEICATGEVYKGFMWRMINLNL